MKQISSRQLYFFLAAIAPVGKLVLMPSQLVHFAKNDLLFPIATNYLLQAALVFCVLLAARANETFYDMLCYTFGKVVAKIVVTVLALFLFYAALLPLLEQKLYIQSVFYDTLTSSVAFSSFFLVSAYLCSKPLVSYGRVWDFLTPVSMIGFFGIMLLSVYQADFVALQPVGAAGIGGYLNGTAFTMSWFFDSVLLLTMIGKFRYQKGMAWKGALSYLAGGAAILLFLATFYGIFSDIASRQLFAFAKISKYFSGITVLGRIDYLFLFMLTLVMVFYCVLPVRAGVEFLGHAYGEGRYRTTLYSIGINAVLLTLSILLDFWFGAVNTAISETLFWIFPAFCILLPLTALLLRRKPREKIS